MSPASRSLCWLLIAVCLVPAFLLAARRSSVEGSRQTATLLLDGEALREQAALAGRDPFELALEYQAEGLTGIVLYEDNPESLAFRGSIAALSGQEFTALALLAGLDGAPRLPREATVLSEIEEGALDGLLRKYPHVPESFRLQDRTWYWFPGDVMEVLPAGPDTAELERYSEAGFDIAWRPRNYPGMRDTGSDFPAEARYLIHYSLELAGNPDSLPELVSASRNYLTGIIEGTDQAGMEEVADLIPTVRLLSFSQEHVNRGLKPGEIIPKYTLAANERGIGIMYLRPWTEEHLGNMIDNTKEMIRGVHDDLTRSGIAVGPLPPPAATYVTNTFLRLAAAGGVLTALLLLGSVFPGPWRLLVPLLIAGVSVLAGGFSWAAPALAAALVFPLLGYTLMSEKPGALFGATFVSLVGAVFLAAVGSDQDTMLAITPFRGVAATLVLPPALYVFQYALRYRRPAQWVREFSARPVTYGVVALAALAAAGAGLILLRRGNFPIIGASEAELALRSWLNELFVRPRFKEVVGHALATVALLVPRLPVWLRAGLLTGGVVAQATILNSFSHYHTPLLISLQRTIIALVIGFAGGVLLSFAARAGLRAWNAWLSYPDRRAGR